MNSTFGQLVCLLHFALLLGSAGANQQFLLKKNTDGTYLLVPAPPNASKESTVDINSLPPITVEPSTSKEAPGVNSQSPLALDTPGSPPRPGSSNAKVSLGVLSKRAALLLFSGLQLSPLEG